MQTLVVDMDAFTKKLKERGYSPTEIATAVEVLKELDVSSSVPRCSSPSCNSSANPPTPLY